MKLTQMGRSLCTALFVGLLLTSAVACQKQEGPAERAGKEVDKATDKVGQQIEKAGDSIQDAAKGDKK
jgi:hypothetical protein